VLPAGDLGGIRGLGPVEVEPDEPVFHLEWEGRTFGVANAMMAKGVFSVDEFRHAIESIHPVAYVSAGYYGRWLWGLERLLVHHGVVTDEEIDARTRALSLQPDASIPRREDPEFADLLLGAVDAGMSPRREVAAPRRFAVGDRVVACGAGREGHTRLPAYARARTGVVVHCHDAFVFPDSNARRAGEDPQWCYCIRFEAEEIWGVPSETCAPVFLDAWEAYLDPAD
jgi:nitrile hydratase beta subunit